MRAQLSAVAGAAAAAGAGATWLAAHQPPDRPTEPGAVLTVVVGASLIGSGLASWRNRPDNRLGPVMILTGFLWFASQLAGVTLPWLYTVGAAVQYVWAVGLVYVLLSFPSGRLGGRAGRGLMAAIGALFTMLLLAMLYGQRSGLRCPSCPHNLLDVFHDNRQAMAWLGLERLCAAVVLVTMIVVLVRRWLRASPPQRRAGLPVLVAGCLSLVALIWTVVFDLLGDPLQSLPATVWYYTTALIPLAVVYVFLQRRLARAMVAGLIVELGAPSTAVTGLREALARAVGDPSLQLAYWFGAERRYVDGDGATVALPQDGSERRATFVKRDGQPIAVLIHDPVLEHNHELVQSVCAAAGLALENERLQAELRARVVELQASRSRLVEATDVERRRIERDLHDGTQQRLVQVAMSLGLLEAKLPGDDASARPLVRETRAALAQALAELRELTHGINPPLLTERGLGPALDELCRRAALPARLTQSLEGRLPGPIESAAYFVVSEALTNAAKHSHGGAVRVSAARAGPQLRIEVADDGIGGAGTAGGSGLRGLADRVEALGGTFTISSPPGRGTVLRAEIPCA